MCGNRRMLQALELSPDNVKALYRKGTAKMSFNDNEEALAIFERIVQKEPENKVDIFLLDH